MIKKYLGRYGDGSFELRITDLNGKSFIMFVGGNLDLYWFSENSSDGDQNFIIEKSSDELLYTTFDKLFEGIKERDNKNFPSLVGNTFSFISEDCEEEYANRLKIVKDRNQFEIKFIKNERNPEGDRFGCQIRFCNSGSRVPRVENLFMQMFNHLAYHKDEVELIRE